MLDVRFRSCRHDDIENIQLLVDELFETYPAEEGLKPCLRKTFAEFSRFP